VVPVVVVEIGRRPGALDVLALVEDGGDGLTERGLEFGAVRLDARGFLGVANRVHAARLRIRRLLGISRRL
jgi:hypothetical protein